MLQNDKNIENAKNMSKMLKDWQKCKKTVKMVKNYHNCRITVKNVQKRAKYGKNG